MRYSSLRPNSPFSARTHKCVCEHTRTHAHTPAACAPLLNYLQWLLSLNSVHHIHECYSTVRPFLNWKPKWNILLGLGLG